MRSSRVLTCCALLTIALAALVGPVRAADDAANAVFLIAKRELSDPNFRETVVLVTHPREGGPWGVIINTPLERRLTEVFPDHESLKPRKDLLYFGGPVQREGLVFLVRSPKPPPRAVQVLRDVYFTGDADWIDGQLKRRNPTRGLRVYAGYSAWAPGQLQSEIERGSWYVLPADAETVFEKESHRIWPELVERASSQRTSYSYETDRARLMRRD